MTIELRAEGISKSFGSRRGGGAARKAVDDVTVAVRPGDFTAIVGESGSGKSTVARMLLGLMAPDSGEVTFDGVPLRSMTRAQRMAFRSSVQCVLQDPSAALNPRKTVRQAIAEVVRLHGRARRSDDVDAKVDEALASVELLPTDTYAERYPHQLSGGQRQRVLIARALILDPAIIIADEAVSALDVAVKAGILNLLEDLRRRRDIGYLFITHDLPVVKKVAAETYVMRSGRVVEHAPTKQLFADPATAYTAELLGAAPVLDPAEARRWLSSAPV